MLKFKYNTTKPFLLMAILIIFCIFTLVSPLIKQEGNPIKSTIAIIKLQANPYSKFSDQPEKYLIKPKNLDSALTELAKEKQIEFTEQMGSGLFFKDKNEQTVFAQLRMFTSRYMVIEF